MNKRFAEFASPWGVVQRGFVDHTAMGARVLWLARIFRRFRVLLADMSPELLVALLREMCFHLVN
jgi:hypothetical protein